MKAASSTKWNRKVRPAFACSATTWRTRSSRPASALDKFVLISGQRFKVIGVGARQGSFLGLFSLDSIVIVPLPTFKRYFSAKSESDVRVKVKDKMKLERRARGELTGLMRRVRALAAGKERRFQYQRATGLQEHARSGEEFHRDRRAIHYRPLALRRRDRDHEHHLCKRERADQGNRHAQGAWARGAGPSCSSS